MTVENQRKVQFSKDTKDQEKGIVIILHTTYGLTLSIILKFIYSEKATKILRNLPLTFDCMYCSQK